MPKVRSARKVGVILGPGGAKAIAHVGVLRALQKQRVPLDRVIGLEWGALVGGIFAHHGQIHEVEWTLYKMAQRDLPRPPKSGLFGRGGGVATVGVMSGFFAETFGGDELSAGRIPFACPSRSLWTGVVTWQTRGAFKDVMERCLPFPPVFNVEGSVVAGASQAAEAIDLLRREGFEVIVFVNVLGSAETSRAEASPERATELILWQEVRRELARATREVEVIEVNTNPYPITQFDAGKDLVRLGEAAGRPAGERLVEKFGF